MDELIYQKVFNEDIKLTNNQYERRCLFINIDTKNIILIRYENIDLDYFDEIIINITEQGLDFDKQSGYYFKNDINNEEELESLILVKFNDGKQEWCRKSELTPELKIYYENNYENQ